MTEIGSDTWVQWYSHPCTIAFVESLKAGVSDRNEQLANAVVYSRPEKDAIAAQILFIKDLVNLFEMKQLQEEVY